MIVNEGRFRPFASAMRCYITSDSVVMDIGSGTGIFSFLACQLGARRIYAVEPDPAAMAVARHCARDVPGSERITWIEDLSTRITLPEQVDVVVGDLHGVMPFFAGNIASLNDARERHLKPGGRMIPQRDHLMAAPAESPLEYRNIESPWLQNALGLDLSAALPWVTCNLMRARSQPIAPEQLFAPPRQWGLIDYTTGAAEHADATLEWTAERAGTLHGLYLWFDGVVAEGAGFSNSPLLPELVYTRHFAPLEQATLIAAGDVIRCRIAVNKLRDSYVYRWETTVMATDGRQKAAFKQSSFKLLPGIRDALHKVEAGYVPTLDVDGQIRREALLAMDGVHTLDDIATLLHAKFPQQFDTKARALDVVAKLSSQHG